jgi:hypothetical protein
VSSIVLNPFDASAALAMQVNAKFETERVSVDVKLSQL